MAAKRFFGESGGSDPDDHHQPKDKRIKTKPALASVIGEVVMMNFLQNFCSALEPMLRRVVNEEMENGLRNGATRCLGRSLSLRIPELVEPSNLKLSFCERLSLPIFTGSKIADTQHNQLQILLMDTTATSTQRGNHNQLLISDHKSTISGSSSTCYPIKVEIVVVDGDFNREGRETWTSEEFNKHVVRERDGKRPLLAGNLLTTMRDGFASIGDIEFTDNSSWIRSRRFRIGARVVQGGSQGVRIREAITESFMVKDHRGELYKKHHPPMLEDEVWRLEKIGRDGAFHKKLTAKSINTVQDFLKLFTVDSAKLRNILGIGMSDKTWEATVRHAKECVMGNKMYISRGCDYTIILNPICQVVKAVINGQTYHNRDFTSMNRAYIENLVKDAYIKWNSLQEVDGILNETPLLTQGASVEQYRINHQTQIRSHQHHALLTDGSTEMAFAPINIRTEGNDWMMNP